MSTTAGYRLWLRRRHAAGSPNGRPIAPWCNTVLATRQQWRGATEQVRALGLPRHPTLEKHWDSLAMVGCILDTTPPSARVLDAGGALYSVLLPWLFLYGYRDLTAVDLSLTRTVRRGPIRYFPGDITRLQFADRRFDVVACQSVLEHGVSIERFLAESSRVLAPGGLLLISVDYFDRAVGVAAIRRIDPGYFVFGPDDIRALIAAAGAAGFTPTTPIDLKCTEAAVQRRQFGLGYTFITLAFRKAGSASAA